MRINPIDNHVALSRAANFASESLAEVHRRYLDACSLAGRRMNEAVWKQAYVGSHLRLLLEAVQDFLEDDAQMELPLESDRLQQ